MTEVSTRPHAGATKAPARAKAAPTPAHDMTTLAAPEAKGITADKALGFIRKLLYCYGLI